MGKSKSGNRSLGRSAQRLGAGIKAVFAKDKGKEAAKANERSGSKESRESATTPPAGVGSAEKAKLQKSTSGTSRSQTKAKTKGEPSDLKSGAAPSPTEAKREKRKDNEADASVFEKVEGGHRPAQAHLHGIKTNLRWKGDTTTQNTTEEDVGDPKIKDAIERLKQQKGIKVVKKRDSKEHDGKDGKTAKDEKSKRKDKKDKEKRAANVKNISIDPLDDDALEDDVNSAARLLSSVKLGKLIEKELSASEQAQLKEFCTSGKDVSEVEKLLDKVTAAAIQAVVTKSDLCRGNVAGEIRMFAVEESAAKSAVNALLFIRKDLLLAAWQRVESKENEEDGTWTPMAKKPRSVSASKERSGDEEPKKPKSEN